MKQKARTNSHFNIRHLYKFIWLTLCNGYSWEFQWAGNVCLSFRLL